MYSIKEYAPILSQGVIGFGNSAAEAIGAMSGTQVFIDEEPTENSLLASDGLTVFCYFFGSIQGIFLLSVPESVAHQMLELADDSESTIQVNEFFKEILNIASGDTLVYLETHFGELTYTPAVTTRGCTTFPPFVSSHINISVPNKAVIKCCIYLNLAEVKIDSELKRIQQSLDETERSARIDSLTQIYNRKYFDFSYETLVERALAEEKKLSLLWIDIDLFKKFNDNYGHQIGDATLQIVGAAIRKATRETDSAYRYGGDEFVIVLHESTLEIAAKVAGRISTFLENHPVHCTKTGTNEEIDFVITLSIGIAQLHASDTPKTFLNRADLLLYQAKERGRNCYVAETL